MRLIDVDKLLDDFQIWPICDDCAQLEDTKCELSGEYICLSVQNAPTVEAIPVVHGHWIYKKNGWAECSECHHDFLGVYDLENSDAYCRHCGAKMDEEA